MFGFPLDVVWSDIEWADQNSTGNNFEYFKFNKQNFTDAQVKQMNSEIESAGRRIVLIFDPHIKVADDYFVYADGYEIQMNETQTTGDISNIFIRNDEDSTDPFYGDCWPDNSTWIDFLNTNAQDYWANLFSKFDTQGSGYLYSAWNDMNEPSVFDTATKTMKLDAVHVKTDGTKVLHEDFHNAYGAFQQKSSYLGQLKRDNNE